VGLQHLQGRRLQRQARSGGAARVVGLVTTLVEGATAGTAINADMGRD
jgi:hypothetical protein